MSDVFGEEKLGERANRERPNIGLNRSGGGAITDSGAGPQTDLNSKRVAGDGGRHQLFRAIILVFFFFFLHGIWGSPRRGPKTYAACNAHLRGQQQGLQLKPRRGQGTEPGRLSPRAPRLARSQQTRAGGQGPGCHHLRIPDSLLPTSLFQRPPPSGRQASS